MLRLIMQQEEPVQLPAANGRYNGNGVTPPNPAGVGLNLNFKVYEIECPELEEALKAANREGSNSKRLVLLGVEIVNKPKPQFQPYQPSYSPTGPNTTTAAQYGITPPDTPRPTVNIPQLSAPDPTALKARLAAKHQKPKRRWFGLFGKKSAADTKPLPLPG